MQQNDCYLTDEQKINLRQISKWLKEGKIPTEWRLVKTFGGTSLMMTRTVDSQDVQNLVNSLNQSDYFSFIECGFFKKIGANIYYLHKEHIIEAVENNFGESMEQPKSQTPQKTYKGLSEEHWNFLILLKNAIKGKYLTQKAKTTFYIRPKEEGENIIDFDGFAPIFLNGHRNELCVPLKIFLDLASLGYLEKARYGHYHVKDKKIIPAVDDYLAQKDGTTTVAGSSAFRLPDSSAQFQCDIFMVMPFREELKPVYTDHIKPLVEGMSYSVKRGDDTFSHHDIITEIWSLINNAKLLIADCTGKNANVFYELGLAHAIDKPVIIITQDEEDIPFDIRQRRYIKYEYTPRGMKQFEEELKKAIQNILGS